MCTEGARVGADTITSYGPAYPYKEESGPAEPHLATAHVICGQSGGGTAHYRLVGSM